MTTRVISPSDDFYSALAITGPGDRLELHSGIYTGINSNDHVIPHGSSWSNAPVIASFAGETATIRSSTALNLVSSSLQYLIFDGVSLDSTSEDAISIGFGTGHIRFTNCEVKNGSRFGVYIGESNFLEFINCNVHHNGSRAGLDHGFYVNGSDCLIERCHIHNNAAYGIANYNGYTGDSSRNVFRGNRIHANGTAGFGPGGTPFGLLVGYGNNSIAYNNLVYSNVGGGMLVGPGSSTKALFNTIYGNTGDAYAIEVRGSGSVVRNNILRNNQLNVITDRGSGSILTPNLIDEDPLFVSVS